MTEKYKLMLYFTIASLHLYRDCIGPPQEEETVETFMQNNKELLHRITVDAYRLFYWDMTLGQLQVAVMFYLQPSRTLDESDIMVT